MWNLPPERGAPGEGSKSFSVPASLVFVALLIGLNVLVAWLVGD